MSHRKIPALRGLLWCLEAARQLKAAPQPIFSMAIWLSLGMLLPGLNFFMLILITVFYGGAISALHKKAQGAQTGLGDFFNGFKSLPRFLSLFMTGLPTILFAIFSSSVLVQALGPDVAQTLAQPGQTPSPELIEKIAPVLLGAILKLLPAAIVVGWIVFLAVPRSILDGRLGFLALWDALRAIMGNIGALCLFSLGMLLTVIAASFLLAIPMALIGNAGALAPLLQTFVLVFISTLAWAWYLNAMYIAWRDIFMTDIGIAVSEPDTADKAQIEI